MREEFQIDSLPVHGLAAQDPQARVVNPAWRDQDRELRRLRTVILFSELGVVESVRQG